MKTEIWERNMRALKNQISKQLDIESETLREIYALRLRLRQDNGQTKHKFSFPISLGASMSTDDGERFEVTVQVGATAARSSSSTVEVGPEPFFGQEQEAQIGHAMKGNGKTRKGSKKVEAGGETAEVDLETGGETRDLTSLFLDAGVKSGMAATITIIPPTIDRDVPQKRHPAGFDFSWWLRLEEAAGIYTYPDADLPDGRRSFPTAAAAMERAHYTLLSRLACEGKTTDTKIREACARAIPYLLREWKRAESAIPDWGDVVTGHDEAEVIDLDAASQDLLTAGDLSTPRATPEQERQALTNVEGDMEEQDMRQADEKRTNDREARKAAKKGRRGKPTGGRRGARK